MLWSSLFIIAVAQGIFLITLLARRGSKNPLAARLLLILLSIIVYDCFIYLIIRTDLVNYIPQIFGTSVGSIFLFGPLFYFYARSVMDSAFQWKKKYWLHFLPYVIQLALNSPMFLYSKADWIWYVENYLLGQIPILGKEKIMFALQDLHLSIYLFAIFRWIRSDKKNQNASHYLIPLSSRIKWLATLAYCFILILITVIGLYIFVLMNGRYSPVTNYIYTLIVSGIIYFIAYRLVFNPELISPDFTQKYKAYMHFGDEEGERFLQKLDALMNREKVFTNPEYRLATLSEQLNLPSHQVSKLINEKFGKTFTDYINEYRVKEFQQRVNDPQLQSLTLYGIALEVGFNSKSSFNTVFKKITGQTPSEYKTPLP